MAISILLVCINIFILSKIIKKKDVNLFLKIIICISYFGWNVVPLLLSTLDEYESTMVTNKELYVFCATVNQLYFVFVFSIFYFLLKRVKSYQIFYKPDFQYDKGFIRKLTYFATFFVIYRIYVHFTSTISYYDANNIENISDDAGVISLFSSFFSYVLLASTLFQSSFFSKKEILFFYFIIFMNSFSAVFGGGRITLFTIVIIIIYIAIRERNKKLITFGFIISIFAFILMPILGSIRGDTSFSVNDISTTETDIKEIVDDIYTKTNSVNTSTPLIEHDGIGGGGAFVYLSTAFALIPRVIMPNKPQPGSKDGTLYGLPSRLSVIYTVKDYNGIYNVGISSSIEMLWAIGWWGLVLLVFLNAYILIIFNQILFGGKPIFVYMFLSLIKLPVCQIDIPLSTLLISVQRFFVITIVLYLIFNKLRKI